MARIDGAKFRELKDKTGFAEEHAAVADVKGKQMKFTPARNPPGLSDQAFGKDGSIVGLLETEAEAAEVGLPPGTHYIWAQSDPNEGWVVYAFDGQGNTQAKAARVESTPGKGGEHGQATPKAVIGQKQWHFCLMKWKGDGILCFWWKAYP